MSTALVRWADRFRGANLGKTASLYCDPRDWTSIQVMLNDRLALYAEPLLRVDGDYCCGPSERYPGTYWGHTNNALRWWTGVAIPDPTKANLRDIADVIRAHDEPYMIEWYEPKLLATCVQRALGVPESGCLDVVTITKIASRVGAGWRALKLKEVCAFLTQADAHVTVPEDYTAPPPTFETMTYVPPPGSVEIVPASLIVPDAPPVTPTPIEPQNGPQPPPATRGPAWPWLVGGFASLVLAIGAIVWARKRDEEDAAAAGTG